MSGVKQIEVTEDEAGLRLDRWFRARFPNLTQGKLQKLLRTGQVRLDGARAKAGSRVEPGQTIRVPPYVDEGPKRSSASPNRLNERDVENLATDLKKRVLYLDDDVIAIDKPAGLAVQGGSKTKVHLDAVLDRLKMGAKERPRLVHRLDRDTSGVLILARTRLAAAALSTAFAGREATKTYWALVVGAPERSEGIIDAPLVKAAGPHGENVRVDVDRGKPAKTRFWTVDAASKSATWLCLQPQTGRTHQLRVHCQAIGTPIFGDKKYGTRVNALSDTGLPDRLHLHARHLSISISRGPAIEIEAPLPDHMAQSWALLGFDPHDERAQRDDL